MRYADIISVSLLALWQHKVRTLLSLLGVAIGTFMLATSMSIGEGVKLELDRQFERGDRLRRIVVRPDYGVSRDQLPKKELDLPGKMDEQRRERILEAKIRRWPRDHKRPKLALNDEGLKKLRELEHVSSVKPNVYQRFRATLVDVPDKPLDAISIGEAVDEKRLGERLVAGKGFTDKSRNDVLVHEYLVYRWGFVDDDDVQQVIGKKIQIDFKKRGSGAAALLDLGGLGDLNFSPEDRQTLDEVMRNLPDLNEKQREVLKKAMSLLPKQAKSSETPPGEEFTIVGVIRDLSKEEQSQRLDLGNLGLDVDLIFPLDTARRLALKVPKRAERGFESVDVYAAEQRHVAAVSEKIRALKLREFSLAEVAERVQMRVTMITWVLNFLAGMALLVSALGITNTMVMSVMERTHEIGIMKAVGAREGHIQLIFLVEGALLGLLGGWLGLLLSWLVSFPADSKAKSMIEAKFPHSLLSDSLFAYPTIIWLGVPLLAGLITTLATVYPAWRAARISPVRALRHE
ncbi:MAG: ABC transporter permease [Planctomycetes bacterium]|nr:ABC transporter permease [Planctomycetota bacterium]